LTQAGVLTLRSRYAEARASCARLQGLAPAPVVRACGAPIDALTGRAGAAQRALAQALAGARRPRERAWLHSLAGELAYWSADHEGAERAFQAALALDPSDRHTRGLLADLWLERDRPLAVRELLREQGDDDGTLLRRALTELALDPARGNALAEQLEARFAEARLRGDFAHQREAGRLALARGEHGQALAHGREGFAIQQEPWDARLLLEAALAIGDAAAAQPALSWLERNQIEAPRLQGLAAKLRRLP
jgi:hypothetical protein